MSSISDRFDPGPSTEVVVTPYVGPYRRDPDFGTVLVGMWAAAATYVVSISLVVFILMLFDGSPSFGQFIAGAAIAFAVLGIGTMAVIAVFVTPIGVVSLLISSLLFHTLRTNARWPTVTTFAGGLTGFFCTAVVFAADRSPAAWYVVLILVGPAAATVFGQVGAAWICMGPRISRSGPVVEESVEPAHQPVRFDIRQLMAATAWMAAVLTVLKVTGLLTGTVLSIIFGWLLFQAVTLLVVLRVVRHIRGHGD